MSGSDPGDKDEPIRRDPFAAMMARLNEQLTRDVEQTARTYAARADSESQDGGAEAPPAARPAVEAKPEAPPRTGKISDATRAQISAAAMARATEAMRNAMPAGADDDFVPAPQGLLQRLAQRKRLVIGLGVGFVVAAVASVGISFMLPSAQPALRADPADPTTDWPKDTPPSTATAPVSPPAAVQEPAPAEPAAPHPTATATATAPVTPPPAPQPPPVAPAPEPVAAVPAPVPAATPPAPPPPTGTPSCPAARQALGLCVPVVH